VSAVETAKQTSDLSALVVKFPLMQIEGLRHHAGAKVGGDLLAPKPINISQPLSGFSRFSMQGLAAKS
jgi:hypothetical protein